MQTIEVGEWEVHKGFGFLTRLGMKKYVDYLVPASYSKRLRYSSFKHAYMVHRTT